MRNASRRQQVEKRVMPALVEMMETAVLCELVNR
jgi:hypothetical protein